MIAFLEGTIVEKSDQAVIVQAGGVGYEVACTPVTLQGMGEEVSPVRLFVHTHYKNDGVALYGFNASEEKRLFLHLLKVDSVGPKSALNILQAAPLLQLVELIHSGDTNALAKLPKISKKLAEHLSVKLKGKLESLRGQPLSETFSDDIDLLSKITALRAEARGALSHLGFKGADVDKALDQLKDEVWSTNLEEVIREALGTMRGNA